MVEELESNVDLANVRVATKQMVVGFRGDLRPAGKSNHLTKQDDDQVYILHMNLHSKDQNRPTKVKVLQEAF